MKKEKTTEFVKQLVKRTSVTGRKSRERRETERRKTNVSQNLILSCDRNLPHLLK